MFNPVSTYRIQFHAGFTFKDFEAIIPYLNELGVVTIYASPIFEAVPASMHGYDGLNPNQINPEIGTIEELKAIVAKLKSLNMNWIQDVVPNHMAYHSGNAWLMDVFRKGEKSKYRKYFDIVSPDLEKDPLMLPFLDRPLNEAIEQGVLEVIRENKEAYLKYYDHRWALKIGTDLSQPLAAIIAEQYFLPCYHLESNERMNYRRFFTINSLICLNMQNPIVFKDYHRLIRNLVKEGIFQGLRIDHVDGLYDPEGYLYALRELCGPETYIVVEKILEPGEVLPVNWPIQGTTGYDYLGMANQLYTNEKAASKFNNFYHKLSVPASPVEVQMLKKKRDFLLSFMSGELDNLYTLFEETIHKLDGRISSIDQAAFRILIAELMVRCPVYRFYSKQLPLKGDELSTLTSIFAALELLEDYKEQVNLLQTALMSPDLKLYRRLMQFTGPLMAKGVEDTLMYTYNRFIGNNEVGDSPGVFGISIADFHQVIQQRKADWPIAMNTTATHDTKRGEDARARLNALTDFKEDWITAIESWRQENEKQKQDNAPDANDEYFIYQTLAATFPEKGKQIDAYQKRLAEYMEKALRESKRHSEWEMPDLKYEAATQQFITRLLDKTSGFLSSFKSFQTKVELAGKINSITSIVLKMLLPGVPDTYQGTELWDLSMVDPDNRRPVDYHLRHEYLKSCKGQDLLSSWEGILDGKAKIILLQAMLKLRRRLPELMTYGDYIPLRTKGRYATNVIAFARRHGDNWLVVTLPVNISSVLPHGSKLNWDDTRIVFPKTAPQNMYDHFTNNDVKAQGEVQVKKLLDKMPVSILHGIQEPKKRGAGLLLHISSLPSRFGIGDLGPAAYSFLDLLKDLGQTYWQVLPMNPLTENQLFSPYSSTSVMAGNVLFISPELLTNDGLLNENSLEAYELKARKRVNYKTIISFKQKLLDLAYDNFLRNDWPELQMAFQKFTEKEAYWLDDYTSYEMLRLTYKNESWANWPVKYRDRNPKALASFKKEQEINISRLKWQQFIFFRQWFLLKERAVLLGVQLIGDLPFYPSLDSADVWANPGLFKVYKGKALGIAGVPPDYFNAEGQLWGMPVYNWEAMVKTGYQWWINRIEKNMELFDLIRLDHFRAFSAYWEVPSGSDSAKTGKWKSGPGAGLFEVFKERFNSLPFFAEDLGEIDEAVYQLRDQFALPGMKVLQFAFDEDMANSIHAPHNYITDNCVVYTGTHDNNTTRGWYQNEADANTKSRIVTYTGQMISSGTIAWVMIRLAYASTASIVIVPVQDLLSKSSKARMNVPASIKNNWGWRIKPDEMKLENLPDLLALCKIFGR